MIRPQNYLFSKQYEYRITRVRDKDPMDKRVVKIRRRTSDKYNLDNIIIMCVRLRVKYAAYTISRK